MLRKVEYDERFNSISVVVEDVHNRPGTFGLYSLETNYEVEIEITPVVNDDDDDGDEYYDGKELWTGNAARNVVLDTAASRRYRLSNGALNSRGSGLNANVDRAADEEDIDAPYASIVVHAIDESVDPSDYGTLYATFQVSTPTKRPTGQAFDVMYHLSVPGREAPSTTHSKRPGHMEAYALLENPLAGTVDLLEDVTITFQITAQDVGSRIVATHVYDSDRCLNGRDLLYLLRDSPANNGMAKISNAENTMQLELAAAAAAGGNGGGRKGNNNNNDDNKNSSNNNDGEASSSVTSWTDVNRVVDSINASSITGAGNRSNPNTRSDTYPEFKANLSMPDDIILRTTHPVSLRGRRSQRVFLFEDAVDVQLFHMYAVNASREQALGSVKVFAHIWRHDHEVVVPGILNICFPEVSGRNMKGVIDRSGFVNLEWKFPAITTVRASQRLCVLGEHECELVQSGEQESGDEGEGDDVRKELAQVEDDMEQGLNGSIQHMRGRKIISSPRPVPPPVSIFQGILTKYLPQKQIFSVFLRNEGGDAQYVGIPFMKTCHDHVFRSMYAMRYASFDAAATAVAGLSSTSFSHSGPRHASHEGYNNNNNNNNPSQVRTRTHHSRHHSLSSSHRKTDKKTPPPPPQALHILQRRIGERDHVVFTEVDAHDECVVVITIHRWTETVVDVDNLNMHDIEQLALWDDVSEQFISRLCKMHDARVHASEINQMQNAALNRCMATRDSCVEVVNQVGVPVGVQYGDDDDDDDFVRNVDVREELMRRREKIRRMCDVVDDAVTHHGHLVKQAWRSATAAEKIQLHMYNVPYEQIANATSVESESNGGKSSSRGRAVRRVRVWPNEYQLDDNDDVDDGGEHIGDGDDSEQVFGVDENDEEHGAGRGVDMELMYYRSVLSRKNVRH